MKTDKKKYEQVIVHLEKASALLLEIGMENRQDWDANRFKYQIEELLESDSGKAGLKQFVRTLK